MLGYILDEIFTTHRAPSGHPERPARAEAIRDALILAGIASRGTHIPIRLATDDELSRVHSAAYLDELIKVVPGNTGWLDPDTYYSPGTWQAARSAVGAACQLTIDVLHGELTEGIAVVRPPGHHATHDRAMGFCLLNNVAAAAAAARANGAARVAIVDWDVHHGNGTQDIFWTDPNVLYMSVHQYPYYPGTGAPTEIGGEGARGATINVGLPGGCGDADYAAVFDHVFMPAIEKFKPDLILISAGFDAFEHDPLAGMRVTHAGFAAMAKRLRSLSERTSGGRIVAVLEGGYDLDGLAGGMTQVLSAFATPPEPLPPIAPLPANIVARAAIEGTLAAHAAAGVPIPDAERGVRHKTADLEPTAFGGRYTLLRRLAIGGMAEIYLARQAAMAGFEKEVVIKRLRAELADDPRIIEMFLDEARIGALLNHPNIVHVYDVDEHDGIPYIAMEYIVGEELNELCRRGIAHGRFLPLEHAVELIRQAAAGMGYFHSKRGAEGTLLADQPLEIVHLDISPSNLLVTQDGFLKVIDFGIARARGQRTRGDVMPGKLSYMSPEQAARSASPETVDHRSDVFSLGIVLYEITVGKRLFRGPASEVVKKLTEVQIEPPTFFRRNFPPALEAIVMRALEKHPADRYQTAYDLADDLESFLRDERLHSGPVRIARYLDMLTHAAGGQRRPELVSEAETRRGDGADELDFDSQVFDGYKATEGAPGPAQARDWEDPEQPEVEVAAALGMELAELRALRTPVPTRPSGMMPVTGKEPRLPTPDPTGPEPEPEVDDEATALSTVPVDDTAPTKRPITIEEELPEEPPAPVVPPVAQFGAPTLPPRVLPVPRAPLPPAPSIGPGPAARSVGNRLPWMLVGGLGMAVLGLLAYIVLT